MLRNNAAGAFRHSQGSNATGERLSYKRLSHHAGGAVHYAVVLPGQKSAFRAGFWPDCYRKYNNNWRILAGLLPEIWPFIETGTLLYVAQ